MTRRVTYDFHDAPPDAGPQPGDLLIGARAHYLVVGTRRVRSTRHPSRWSLELQRIEAPDNYAGARCFTITWNKRRRSR